MRWHLLQAYGENSMGYGSHIDSGGVIWQSLTSCFCSTAACVWRKFEHLWNVEIFWNSTVTICNNIQHVNNNVLQQECPSGVSAWSCEKRLLKVSSTRVSHTSVSEDGAPKSVQQKYFQNRCSGADTDAGIWPRTNFCQGDGHLFGPSQPSRASSFLASL